MNCELRMDKLLIGAVNYKFGGTGALWSNKKQKKVDQIDPSSMREPFQ